MFVFTKATNPCYISMRPIEENDKETNAISVIPIKFNIKRLAGSVILKHQNLRELEVYWTTYGGSSSFGDNNWTPSPRLISNFGDVRHRTDE